MKELLQIIEQISDKRQLIAIQSGTAKNVTDNKCDVSRIDNADLLDVRLNALPDVTDYATIIPAEGSTVLVGLIDGIRTEAFLIACSEIEKIIWKKGGSEMLFDDNGFQFSRQNESLKKILTDLVQAIMQLTVTTNSGPSGTPINIAAFQQIMQRIPNLLT